MNKMINENTLFNFWYSCIKKYPEKEAIIWWKNGEEPYRWTYLELFSLAEKFAVEMRNKGIKKGEVCAIIIRHNIYFYPIYLAVVMIGAIPTVLVHPNPRLHQEKFVNGIMGMTKKSGLDWILTEKDFENILHSIVYFAENTIKGMLYPIENIGRVSVTGKDLQSVRENFSSVNETDTLLLQHSSGTTGLQKPVLLTHGAVCRHLINYSNAIQLGENDKVVNWLPFYHDMGLIAAFHLPLAMGITSIQIDPFEWALKPTIIFDAIRKEKATLTWMPNFAFNFLASKIKEEELEKYDLGTMRMFVNCAEPIRHESFEKFKIRFVPVSLSDKSIASSYAMAEATFAVTQSIPGEEPTKLYVDSTELEKGKITFAKGKSANTKVLTSSGRIINGCRLRIVDEQGHDLDEKQIGEILVKSESLFSGYRNYSEKTNNALKNGWYYSGDNGFMYKDNLYVLGRKDDIIISAGIRIYPEDVEDSINDVVGVIPGRVIAFGQYEESLGTNVVCVIAETDYTTIKDKRHLKTQIIQAGLEININIRKVYLVPHRWLIKTSSGKPSRKESKKKALEENKKIEI